MSKINYAEIQREATFEKAIDVLRNAHSESEKRGWWDGVKLPLIITDPNSINIILAKLALCNSELTEADDAVTIGPEINIKGKPEGYLPEIADYLIRISDLCGALNYNEVFDKVIEQENGNYLNSFVVEDINRTLLNLYARISRMIEAVRIGYEEEFIKNAVYTILYVTTLYPALPFHIIAKQEYNKTRSYKHGGKLA